MARKFTRSRGRHGSARETLWIAITPTVNTLSVASTALLFTGFSAGVLALRPFTIIRSRGWFHVASDQGGVSENYDCALGFAVVSDQALAIGVTAVPTPNTDRDSDLWMVYEEVGGRWRFDSAAGVTEAGVGTKFDSKGMRKVEEGQDLAITIENSAVSLGAVVYKSGRMLIKLH